jgi:hypothetical protein
MNMSLAGEKIRVRLDRVTRKWWWYLFLVLLFFIPPSAAQGYRSGSSMDLIEEVLSDPLIYAYPVLMPIAKVIAAVLVVAVIILGNRMRRVFNGYVALLYIALACLQSTALTDQYGLVILSGNLALILVVALLWVWELFAERNDFAPRERPLWKWWVAPLALLALLGPVDASTMTPDFRLARLLTSESGLTYCMMTPVILAVATLYHPTVNLPLVRVSGFVGIVFGVMNLVTWFILEPWGWWMGVLHIPLLTISTYAFVLGSLRRGPQTGEPA